MLAQDAGDLIGRRSIGSNSSPKTLTATIATHARKSSLNRIWIGWVNS